MLRCGVDAGCSGGGKELDSRFGRLHLVDLTLELMPCRRGRRGSTRHLRGVKSWQAQVSTRREAYNIGRRHSDQHQACTQKLGFTYTGQPKRRQPWREGRTLEMGRGRKTLVGEEEKAEMQKTEKKKLNAYVSSQAKVTR